MSSSYYRRDNAAHTGPISKVGSFIIFSLMIPTKEGNRRKRQSFPFPWLSGALILDESIKLIGKENEDEEKEED